MFSASARRAIGFLVVSLLPLPVWAQTGRDDPAVLAAFRLGPLALTPTVALRDIGVDTNVLGQPEADPDFTMTFVPGARAWLRISRVRLSSDAEVEWQYYQKTEGQRAFSVTETGKAELLLAYLTPYVEGTWDNTKRRQSAEFNVRVRQKTTGWAAGAVVHLGPRTDLDLRYEEERHRLGDAEIGGIGLAELLDRDRQAVELEAGYAVTALTRLVARVAVERDRFTRSPVRDADSVSVLPGVEFKASALVSGTAFVGYRSFETLDPSVRDFRGLVASVDLKYVARDMTKVEVQVSRNVEYSFEIAQPFFVERAWSVALTQALNYDWDVRAEVGRTDLDYQPNLGVAGPARADRLWVYGVGMGRRFGIELRVGVDVGVTRRESTAPGRTYDGLKVGGSVTYGY